jgi:hypothetical protein
VTGEFARGIDNHIIDLILICDKINREYLARLTAKAELLIKRKIRYLIMTPREFEEYRESLHFDQALLLWRE